jgi:hypothetical protein
MAASAAVMILLMCSPASSDCMEIRSDRTYENAALCREALPSTLARLNRDGRSVSGRCAVSAEPRPELDPIITCSTGTRATTTVRVTHLTEGGPIIQDWIVPRHGQPGCG